MDLLESILKLTESDRQKITETLQLLKNVGSNVMSNVSASTSGTDLNDSLNLSNNIPEKPMSKQKTLDSWIVKSKTPLSNSKEVTYSKEIALVVETGEPSRHFDYVEVSSTLENRQLPSSSSTPIGKSSKPENMMNTNEKQLRVLLNRQDCLGSNQKSPDHCKFSSEKKSISPTEIKSPIKKQEHSSKNSDQQILTPEKHLPSLACSYNLRRARGILDEKSSIETTNSMPSVSVSEETDKIHKSVNKSVTKQKPKVKNSLEKDASSNSITSLEGMSDEQETDSFNAGISEENRKNSECKTSPVVLSELEKISKVISVDSNKITITDGNPMLAELDATVVVKGKRKRTSKSKESNKLNASNTAQKSSSIQESGSPEEINVNIINTRSAFSKKVTKLNSVNTNPSESSIEKTVQFHETVLDTSASEKQVSQNDLVKPVSKLKVRKTTKSKDKNDLVSYEKTKLDSCVNTKIKKKNSPIQIINSSIRKDVDFEKEVSAKNSKLQNDEHVRDIEDVITKHTNAVTSVNLDSKRTCRKTGSENKRTIASRNSLLPDPGLASKANQGTITSIEKSSKLSPSQIKEFAKETEVLLAKDTKSVNSKRISRKKGNENKSMIAAENNLLLEPDLTSKNNDKNNIISTESLPIDSSKISPSHIKECAKETEKLLIKDTNTVTSVNLDTKRRSRKRGSENKRMVTTKKSLLPDSEQGSINKDSIISIEISSKDSTSIPKEISTKQTSLINNTSASEKITLSLNQNKYSQSVTSGDGDSHNELNSLNEMKEPPEDQSQKSGVVSPKVLRSNDNIVLHLEECSKLSTVSKKVNTLKRKTLVQSSSNSKKKSKISEDKNQSNTSQSISDNLGTEIENTGIIFKKCESKKKATFSKQKVTTDSNKDQSDILVTKSKANSSNSNVVQEPKDQLLKNSKSNNTLAKGQKEKTRNTNSKKINESLSKKTPNSLKSQAVCDINLHKNDEIEKMNCDLVEESSVKNKLRKTLFEKKIKKSSIKSSDKGKSTRKTDLGSSSEKLSDHSREYEHSSEKSSEVQMELDSSIEKSSQVQMELDSSMEKSSEIQMELDSSHSSAEKSETCDTSTSSKHIVDSGKAQGMIPVASMDILLTNTSESGEEKNARGMEESTKKTDDLISNSSNVDVAQTNFKSSVEFDEMKHNYEAYCKVKEILEVIGMSIEELFENPEMINSLKSAQPDGVYFISKCKSNSKISVYMHESKKELKNILNRLKKEYTDKN